MMMHGLANFKFTFYLMPFTTACSHLAGIRFKLKLTATKSRWLFVTLC